MTFSSAEALERILETTAQKILSFMSGDPQNIV
jgi:hypothetical protein